MLYVYKNKNYRIRMFMLAALFGVLFVQSSSASAEFKKFYRVVDVPSDSAEGQPSYQAPVLTPVEVISSEFPPIVASPSVVDPADPVIAPSVDVAPLPQPQLVEAPASAIVPTIPSNPVVSSPASTSGATYLPMAAQHSGAPVINVVQSASVAADLPVTIPALKEEAKPIEVPAVTSVTTLPELPQENRVIEGAQIAVMTSSEAPSYIPVAPISVPSSSEFPRAKSATSGYVLGAGDVLRVIVYGDENLSGEFIIDAGGQISMPLIQDVSAAGYTARDLEQMIINKLHPAYLNNPKVSVQVIEYRSVYVLGEVRLPGKYPYVPNMTLLQAVAVAGGHTYRADEKNADISRQAGNTIEKLKANADTMILPGDTIVVNRRWF